MCKGSSNTLWLWTGQEYHDDGILLLFFEFPTGVIVTPPRHTKLILRPVLLCVPMCSNQCRSYEETHPLVSDMESSVLALAELTREEADKGVPLFMAARTCNFILLTKLSI